jgi:hypothetical protein
VLADVAGKALGKSPGALALNLLRETQSCRVDGPIGSTGAQGWESHMDFILAIIVGCLLTVAVAYFADTGSPAGAKPLVNWDVVSERLNSLTALAREGWKKITGFTTYVFTEISFPAMIASIAKGTGVLALPNVKTACSRRGIVPFN